MSKQRKILDILDDIGLESYEQKFSFQENPLSNNFEVSAK